MCLMVWVASERPLPTVVLADPQVPDPVTGYHHVEPVADDAAVRARFALPCVTYVGSHEGCGCGYNSGLAYDGFERVDDVKPLLDALDDEERVAFVAGQGSRERLRDLVIQALRDGPVEVFGCWAGDEVSAAVEVEEVGPEHFAEQVAPIGERVLYRIRHPDPAAM